MQIKTLPGTTKQMEKNDMNMKGHTCPVGHCCGCSGCDGMGGSMMMHHGGMRGYWRRHFMVLVIGVILAFFVGMKLGVIKGYMMRDYGMYPMHHGYMMQNQGYAPVSGTVPTGTPTPAYPAAQ